MNRTTDHRPYIGHNFSQDHYPAPTGPRFPKLPTTDQIFGWARDRNGLPMIDLYNGLADKWEDWKAVQVRINRLRREGWVVYEDETLPLIDRVILIHPMFRKGTA